MKNDHKMKIYNSTLRKKQQKYLHYDQVKVINANIFQMKNYYHLIKVGLQKFTYFPLGKALEKITKTIQKRVKKQILDKDLNQITVLFSKDFLTVFFNLIMN